MSLRLVALCVDADDPLRLARFWGEALRWAVADGTEDRVPVLPTDGTGFRMEFVRNPAPKVGPNRLHLDLTSTSLDDQREFVERLLSLGARHLDIGQGPDESHVVLADPEGNELCVLEPGNSFVSDSSRLGSITCEGTREVGLFWSAALGWPLVWDQDEETAVRAPDGTHTFITWGGAPPPKVGRNRLHLEVAPAGGAAQEAEVERLVPLGATLLDRGEGGADRVALADPDGNELCVLPPA
ncbi:MAG TPA: VOC family protein [Acidimicrobiales bacterium]|jgi:hypothetical protein